MERLGGAKTEPARWALSSFHNLLNSLVLYGVRRLDAALDARGLTRARTQRVRFREHRLAARDSKPRATVG
jgi:hypothetical protein